MNNETDPSKTAIEDFLQTCPWFSGIPREVLFGLATHAEWRTFGADQVLYRRGVFPTGVFGVVHGSFKIVTSSRDGRDAVTTVLGRDTWFGEICLFASQPYIADCIATQPSKVMFIAASALFDVCDQVPLVQKRLLVEVSKKAMAVYWMSSHYKLASPELRIAHRLEIARQSSNTSVRTGTLNAKKSSAWTELSEPMSHEVIAQMVGLSRPRVSTAMKALERAGVLTSARGRIRVNVVRLKAFCQDSSGA